MSHVLDSSIWGPNGSALNKHETRLMMGIVLEALNDSNKGLRYLVQIYYRSDRFTVPCRQMRSVGGVYNYEDSVLRGYDHKGANSNQGSIAALAGDLVLVGFIGGVGSEGIILGGLTHPARKSSLDAKKGPQYRSEFNGIETHINEVGEWTLTFKGQPTNLQKLKDAPNQVLPAPQYDKDITGSFMKWDKTGSFTLSDMGDGDKVQKLFIDKKNQKTILTTPLLVVKSGKVRLGEENASDWLILGSTFREKQKSMNQTVSMKLLAAKIALEIAKTMLQTAGASMAAPIVGAVAAAPQITAASVAIGQASSAIGDAGQAVSDFESAGAPHDYLSAISKTK